ncbi:MAG: hypothetical protein OEX80_09575 [Candidatus Aminicenantes bacterium]|nr:hypothetical protein [Candidatus Aminicenantes bacterium]
MTCCYMIPAFPFGSHHWGMSHHGCDCCCPGYERFPRRFLSPEEEKKQLEKYREELQKELAAVEEMLKKTGR